MAFDKLVKEFNDTVGSERGIIVEAFSQGNVVDLSEKVLDSANKKLALKMYQIYLQHTQILHMKWIN